MRKTLFRLKKEAEQAGFKVSRTGPLGGGRSTREVPFSHSHKPKVSSGAGKGQLCPALTRLCGASCGYEEVHREARVARGGVAA